MINLKLRSGRFLWCYCTILYTMFSVLQRRQKTFKQALVLDYGIDLMLLMTVMQDTAITQDEYSFFVTFKNLKMCS